MIHMDRVKENPSIYREKKVILWGCGRLGKLFLELFHVFDLTVLACCSNDESTWGTEFFQIPVLSPKELGEKWGQDEEIVLQLAVGKKQDEMVAQQGKDLGFQTIVESFSPSLDLDELYLALLVKEAPQFCQEVQSMAKELVIEENLRNNSISVGTPEAFHHLVVNQPGKTGDNTIVSTYNKLTGAKICHSHNPALIHLPEEKNQKIKVVTGIRDPIARDVSVLFQRISNGRILREPNLCSKDFMFYLEQGKVQHIFDVFSENRCSGRLTGGVPSHDFSTFYNLFSKHVLDVKKFTFDKEKGFSIFREGNVEVFVYQLEKLNDSVPQLSQWMELPFEQLEIQNAASDKWIHKDYKKAQKELKFTPEYLELCYTDPYVQFFYSSEDIAKFRKKWENV